MLVTDHIALDARTVRETRDGYLVGEARVARTGIQTYAAGELGLTDREPSETVRIYRSPEEVFDKPSMESFTWRPMTNDHPSEMVTADSWKRVSVGMTGDRAKREVADDGEYLVVPLTLMDRDAINDYRAGKRQLSNGYQCELDMTPGTVPTTDKFHAGQAFDGRQIRPRGNHIALCDAARGGPKLTFGDAYTPSREEVRTFFDSITNGDHAVTLKTIIVDGLPVEITAAGEAAVTKLQGQLTDAAKAKDTAEAKVVELTAAAVTKDAEIVKLKDDLEKAKVTPQQMRDAAKAYAHTCAKAKALGVTVGDNDDELTVKRAVVNAKMGDQAKAYTDEHVSIAFDSLTAGVKVDDTSSQDPLRSVLLDGPISRTNDAAEVRNLARAMQYN